MRLFILTLLLGLNLLYANGVYCIEPQHKATLNKEEIVDCIPNYTPSKISFGGNDILFLDDDYDTDSWLLVYYYVEFDSINQQYLTPQRIEYKRASLYDDQNHRKQADFNTPNDLVEKIVDCLCSKKYYIEHKGYGIPHILTCRVFFNRRRYKS